MKRGILVLGIMMSSTLYSSAQVSDSELEGDEGEEYVEEQKFFNDINEERFKSSLNDVNGSSKIDYSSPNSRRERPDFNVFGNENEVYQFKENQIENSSSNKSTITIGSDQGVWQQAPQTNQAPNTNMPSVTNPFGSNPGVKAPRNMDAVPDNGDDPNDVPLDGGASILGLAAIVYGFKKNNRKETK
ncbi:MAG: hypothetical protein ACOVP1_02250 [Bacteroidia bacterium]